MRLYEEYLQRHGIVDVPLVHHSSFTTIFLNLNSDFDLRNPSIWESFYSTSDVRTGFLEIVWNKAEGRPGRYKIGFYYISHDSYYNGVIKFKYQGITELLWDEYESFMFSLVNSLNTSCLFLTENKAILANWELFVHGCDYFFSQQNGDIKYLLFHSLDKENSEVDRLGYIHEVLRKIYNFQPLLVRCWEEEFLNRVHSQSEWLTKLIESKCKNSMHQ